MLHTKMDILMKRMDALTSEKAAMVKDRNGEPKRGE
jgi:hypothetical protein